jgi:hypothetical protein
MSLQDRKFLSTQNSGFKNKGKRIHSQIRDSSHTIKKVCIFYLVI